MEQNYRNKQRSASQKSGKLVVSRRDVLTLRCSDCNLPFLEITNGEINIQSKHGSKKHSNTLTVAQLKRLLVEMIKQKRPEPELW